MGRYCIYDLLIWRPMSYGDLEVLLRSRVPLIVVESRDESRVLKLLQRACRRAPVLMPAPVAARADDLTVATLCTANARRTPPSAQSILAEMTATRPLSILMAERISALRRWAAGRAVPAG
jgi:hypothetical protein